MTRRIYIRARVRRGQVQNDRLMNINGEAEHLVEECMLGWEFPWLLRNRESLAILEFSLLVSLGDQEGVCVLYAAQLLEGPSYRNSAFTESARHARVCKASLFL